MAERGSIYIPLRGAAPRMLPGTPSTPPPGADTMAQFRAMTANQMADGPSRMGAPTGRLGALIQSGNIPYDRLLPEQLAGLAQAGDPTASRLLMNVLGLAGDRPLNPDGTRPQGPISSAVGKVAEGVGTTLQPAYDALRYGTKGPYGQMAADEQAAMAAPALSPDMETMRPGPGAGLPMATQPTMAAPRMLPATPAAAAPQAAPYPDMELIRPQPGGGIPGMPNPFEPQTPGPSPATALASPAPTASAPGVKFSKEDLLNFGLSLMAAGGQPGATIGGSVGQAGLATMQAQKTDRKEKAAGALKERELAQADRKIANEERKLIADAQESILKRNQLASDKDADRELRREISEQNNQIRKLMAEATAGNQQSMRELQRLTLETRVDTAAADFLKDRKKALEDNALTSGMTPEQVDAAARKDTAEAFPESSFGRAHGRKTLTAGYNDTLKKIDASTKSPDEKETLKKAARATFDAELQKFAKAS